MVGRLLIPVNLILAVALVASQVTTFGCTSIEDVSRLKSLRSDQKAFQAALVEKQTCGECVTILQRHAADNSILGVNQEVEPPGYEAPREDFEVKAFTSKGPGRT
jgi:hypothetical protein